MVWISEQLGGSTQQLFGHSACRRLLESFAHVGLAPEYLQRCIQSFVQVEGAWPASRRPGLPRFLRFHLPIIVFSYRSVQIEDEKSGLPLTRRIGIADRRRIKGRT